MRGRAGWREWELEWTRDVGGEWSGVRKEIKKERRAGRADSLLIGLWLI